MQVPRLKIVDPVKNCCFACGKENPQGLKLQFTRDGEVAKAEFTPGEFHQGWPGFTHGGILFTLLDEVSGYAVRYAGLHCVTAKSEVRFIKMATVGETILLEGRITKNTPRLIETEATLSLKDGTTIARSSSLWYVVKEHLKE
jgi:acyl-coenzyme A thioesterase PaaI-like protein